MKKQIDAVKDFHDAFEEVNATEPTLLPESIYNLRHKIMVEEVDEYLEACKKGDIVEVADALGDQLYILCGTLLKHGLQHKIEEVFDEIHRSNMSKLDENGRPLRRDDGKIIKGPRYFKPNLKPIVGEVNTFVIGKDSCPYCGKHVDMATGVNDAKQKPIPGDFSICAGCGGICKYGDDMGLEKFPDLLLDTLEEDQKNMLLGVQAQIRKLRGLL